MVAAVITTLIIWVFWTLMQIHPWTATEDQPQHLPRGQDVSHPQLVAPG